MPRKPRLVISAPRRADGLLSIVEVSEGQCVMSTGEVLLIRYEKLRGLAEWVCQERSAVSIRTWTSRDGAELIDLHQRGAMRTGSFSDVTPNKEREVF